ncbi:GNAT family N-acetyltransferase [Bacillus piscicola]|uniref:GNAT family N-acetyltransferase n=1 Tax=Bacillus piscicola TaxID=1632684 RepID=UPI001F09D29C|nr:GNAT family N-acetyltransferase [Bacillus piscicola]
MIDEVQTSEIVDKQGGEKVITIKKAAVSEIDEILSLINRYTEQGILLKQTRRSLYNNLSLTYVAVAEDEIIGTASLYQLDRNLAEVRSLAVDVNKGQSGIGRALVERLIKETKHLHIKRIMATTGETGFFAKCGFHLTDIENVPQKMNQDCSDCSELHVCTKQVMIMSVT